jgi:hypothetical protein
MNTTSNSTVAYCDYIAHLISKEIKNADQGYYQLIVKAGRAFFDLGPNGEFYSTKKTLFVTDVNGKRYRITVEEDNASNALV